MRLAVLSDTHGNLPALEAVLADIEGQDMDGVIVAGDIAGGPQSVETIRRLRELNAWMIRGNSGTRLLRYAAGEGPAAWHTHHQYGLMRWSYRNLDEETLAFIRSLPEQRVVTLPGTAAIRIVHGSPRNPSESIFPDRDPTSLDIALAQTTEPVLVCGHTHTPWVEEKGERLALNPGAVCGSLIGDVRAWYALLTWQGDRWHATHRAIPYDLAQIRAVFRESGLLEEGGALARCFLLSIETGLNVAEDFLAHARKLMGESSPDDSIIPDPIWEQAAKSFRWTAYRE